MNKIQNSSRLSRGILSYLVLTSTVLLQAACSPQFKGAYNDALDYNIISVRPGIEIEDRADDAHCYAEQDRQAIDDYQYRLGKGDRLFIRLAVINSSETYRESHGSDLTFILPQPHLSQQESSFQINELGNINVPYAGTVAAEGLTIAELQIELSERFSQYVRNPYTDVKVFEYRSKFVEVQGQITTPQRLEIDDHPMTITRALKLAGGVAENGDLKAAFVESASGSRQFIDLFSLLSRGETKYNLLLQPGDTLVIPYTDGNEVFVTGEVIDRKTIQTSTRPLSLTQAILEANGPHPFAGDASGVFVFRDNDTVQPLCNFTNQIKTTMLGIGTNTNIDVFHFDMKQPEMYVLANDFMLQKNDIVYVATRPITNWQRLITQILPANISFWADPRTYQ